MTSLSVGKNISVTSDEINDWCYCPHKWKRMFVADAYTRDVYTPLRWMQYIMCVAGIAMIGYGVYEMIRWIQTIKH